MRPPRALEVALSALGPSSALVAVAMLALGFAPLFAGPGYESALAAGIVVPPLAAAATAIAQENPMLSPLARLSYGLSRGLVLVLVAYATALLHGARAGFCGFAEGSLLWLLGPLPGALLGGAWGAVASLLVARARTPRRRAALGALLALSGPLLTVVASLVRFLTSPMVFAFDPFVGYFSGTLYDTVIDGVDRLVTYRLGTAATLLAAIGVAIHRERPLRFRPLLAACTFAMAAASVGVTAGGARLGHWQTPTTIRAALGGERVSRRCVVLHPRAMRDEEVTLFARDCDVQADAVAAYLGVASPPVVTVYLFADAAQKRRLMGAADVYIAKPWREEVYVQAAGYPHPVLGHELAHVIAGAHARGPFRVAGALGGLLPDPGLIEGIAVAAAPDDDELSPEAWSRAMLELGILPPIQSIFSLGFLGHDAGRAYTVAGAFVAWVRATFGERVVQQWYGGASLPALTARSWADLDRGFRDALRALAIPDAALALAKARFDRPALFGRTCPHEIDAKKRTASAMLASGDTRGAVALLDEVLRLDRRDASARLSRATCSERTGDEADARERLAGVQSDGAASRTARDRAEERLGDLALVRGDTDEAEARYAAVAARVLDEDHLRTLDVKRVGVASAASRAALVALLVGPPRTGPDALLGAEELGRWATRDPEDGLPLYLLGRSAATRGQWARAAELFAGALSRSLPGPRVRREAARQRVIAGCALRDPAAVADGLRAWSAESPPPGNRDTLLRALAARCL